MLFIKRNTQYIGEGKNGYYLTKYIDNAKNFFWLAHLWFGKKVILDGINYKFGNGFEYIKINKKRKKNK